MKNIYRRTLASLHKLGCRPNPPYQRGKNIQDRPINTGSNVYIYSKELNSKQRLKELSYKCDVLDIQDDLKKLEDQIDGLIANKTKGD